MTPNMRHHTLLLAATLVLSVEAYAAEFVVDRADGAVYLRNPGVASETIDAYSLFSPGGALIVGGWTPITGNYDLGADQSVDAAADWFVINASASNVAEASTLVGSGSLAAGEIVSLGLLFDTGLLEGLVATTSANGTTSDPFPAFFRDLEADYDGDLDVDADDYDVFASTFGSTMDLRADGNDDGVVDSADYTVWRDALAVAASEADASLSPLGIPEPAGAAMALVALVLSSGPRRGR